MSDDQAKAGQSIDDVMRDIRQSAQLDQISEALTNIARMAGLYLRALLDAGFTRDEAIELVADWQATILRPRPPQS